MVSKTLVGSAALAVHLDLGRVPHDTDYYAAEPVPGGDNFYHPDLEKWPFGEVATLDELYTIKVSHSYWNLRKWNLHTRDIILMQENDATLIPELHDLLYPVWEELHGVKRVTLEASAEDFFNNRVERLYDHDSIHLSIAYGDAPMFERILREGSEVAVSKAKFDALSQEEKLMLAREEFYATALERMLIPAGYRMDPHRAYQWALRKTVTSLSKGWFPRFIMEHASELRKADMNYLARHRANRSVLIPLQ